MWASHAALKCRRETSCQPCAGMHRQCTSTQLAYLQVWHTLSDVSFQVQQSAIKLQQCWYEWVVEYFIIMRGESCREAVLLRGLGHTKLTVTTQSA